MASDEAWWRARKTGSCDEGGWGVTVERAQAYINLAAIERNCGRLRRALSPGTELCAVVKADGYGHGAVECARAALAGGATWLAVATAEEASELGRADLDMRLLVMGALSSGELGLALCVGADVVAWREEFVALAEEVTKTLVDEGFDSKARVHVKLDSGMGRLGTRDPGEASRVAALVAANPHMELVGAMTHFATADELGDEFFGEQLERFGRWGRALKAQYPQIVLHAANSAAALRDPAAHFDMARCGVAIYGMDPFGKDPYARELEPALELSSFIADVKPCRAGESTGYGRRFIAREDTLLGVLPIGYGDGWRRGLSNNADVLIDGRRYPLVGTVSMDNVAVDLGPNAEQLRGRRAVLVGMSGSERITAEEVALRLDTINYEIACGLTARVERWHHKDSPRKGQPSRMTVVPPFAE
jgi:alanine racemase